METVDSAIRQILFSSASFCSSHSVQ